MENEAPALGPYAWTVAEDPVLVIGAVDGPPEYLFDGIMGAARLADRRIVVADRGSSQLRFYDGAGRFLHAVGRIGQGPGEFGQIRKLDRLAGDTLAVEDFPPRTHLFDPSGRFVRSVGLARGSGSIGSRLVGAFRDGTLLATEIVRTVPGRSMPDSLYLFRLGPDESSQDTVGRFRFVEWARFRDRPTALVFGPVGHFVVSGDHFHYGFGDRYELRRYGSGGHLERLVRRAWIPQPVTDTEIRTYRRRYVDGDDGGDRAATPELRRQREQALAEMRFADRSPAYAAILADQGGNLWVQEYSVPHAISPGRRSTVREPSEWSVFDPEGRWLTTVVLPGHLAVMEIGDEYVLGLARDESGVEQIRMYEMVLSGQRP